MARVFGPFSSSDKPVVLNPGCIRKEGLPLIHVLAPGIGHFLF